MHNDTVIANHENKFQTDLFFVRQLAEASFELGTIHSEQIWRKSTNVDALDRSATIAAWHAKLS